jgi:hypothetical protein
MVSPCHDQEEKNVPQFRLMAKPVPSNEPMTGLGISTPVFDL